MSEIENKEPEYSLPKSHVDITDKKGTIDLDKILNKESELILFELPKNFNKENIKKMRLDKIINSKKRTRTTKILDNYEAMCYGENHPASKQTLAILNNKNKKRLVFKPINKFVKVYESLSLFEPSEDAIIKRKLRCKK